MNRTLFKIRHSKFIGISQNFNCTNLYFFFFTRIYISCKNYNCKCFNGRNSLFHIFIYCQIFNESTQQEEHRR